ncbi:DUF2293 domain-containing protein [Labrys sp. La1]|uniref:DUF2293 domain-containing protein n=1 Tax=Labrys sp. La1 TaxID=3404917 RepID=UPI003EBCC17D
MAVADDEPMTEPAAASKRRRTSTRFTFEEVLAHIQHHHPLCPEATKATIARKVASRPWWTKTTLGRAVGMTIHSYVRHKMTDYDSLYQINGITREEAHAAILPEVNTIVGSWQEAPDNGSYDSLEGRRVCLTSESGELITARVRRVPRVL